ncbi:MAG: response regulator [Thermoplasmata archaeon]|nr:MAG: response regulator [Thermoplasmata archaeon]
MRVLIVDDNATLLAQLKKYLTLKHFTVDTAGRGEDALSMLETGHYEVLIIDLKMPGLSGMDVLRWIHGRNIHSKVIVITGYGDTETAVEVMKLGAAEYIQKPFDPEELARLIEKVVMLPEARAPARESDITWITDFCSGMPTLLITDTQRDEFEKGISPNRVIHLSSGGRVTVTIEELERAIKKFAENTRKGTVIHAGMVLLLSIYGKNAVREHMARLHRMAGKGAFRLLVLYPREHEETIAQLAEDAAVIPFIKEVADVLGNDIRREIILLLEKHSVLPYKQFVQKLDVTYSSKAAFHLKKLMSYGLITKKGREYCLTPHGRHMAKMFHMLKLYDYRDPTHAVQYHQISL